MIFSSKAEYGVRLMVELGRQTPERPISLKAIADAEGLPLAYLEQVVARLRKAQLVMSARGAHGGYWLSRPADEISMDEVVQALEGSIAPMECFVHVRAGDKEILRGLDLEVSKGEIHALMGPNGSGKSTLANTIMGHPNLEVTDGQIFFKGEDITDAAPDERARMGLFMAFQYPVS